MSAAAEAEELRAMIDRAIALPQVSPRTVAQARARNAARMLAVSYLCQQATDDAMAVIVQAGGASYVDAYIAMRQWAVSTLAEMSDEAREAAA